MARRNVFARLTDMKVAGKNIIVRRVIDFITALSELASILYACMDQLALTRTSTHTVGCVDYIPRKSPLRAYRGSTARAISGPSSSEAETADILWLAPCMFRRGRPGA